MYEPQTAPTAAGEMIVHANVLLNTGSLPPVHSSAHKTECEATEAY